MTPPDTGRGRIARIVGRLAAIGIGVAISLLLTEAVLRLAGIGSAQLLQPDLQLGLRFIPSASGPQHGACYHSQVSINRHGWRGPEVDLAKPAGTKRVVVLGDSFMAGLQVDDDETFPRQLEQRLRGAGENVEVINLGVPAFGTDQEFVAWREFGRAYQPDLVLLAFFAQNDIRNNWVLLEGHTIAKPFFDVIDGQLVELPLAAPPSLAFRTALRFVAPFRLYPIVRDTIRYGLSKRDDADEESLWGWPGRWRDQVEVLRTEQSSEWRHEWRHSWRITERLIVALRDDVAATGADFLLVGLSDPVSVVPDAMLEQIAAASISGEVDRDGPSHRLASIADDHGIHHVSLLPAFRERIGQSEEALSRYYLKCDGHWTPLGHALAAEVALPEVAAVLRGAGGGAR